jgi:hypothetical protein
MLNNTVSGTVKLSQHDALAQALPTTTPLRALENFAVFGTQYDPGWIASLFVTAKYLDLFQQQGLRRGLGRD